MKTRNVSAMTAALAATWLAGCSSAPPPAASPAPGGTPAAPASSANLEGTSWRLVQIAMNDGVTRPAIDRSRYTVGFGAAGAGMNRHKRIGAIVFTRQKLA